MKYSETSVGWPDALKALIQERQVTQPRPVHRQDPAIVKRKEIPKVRPPILPLRDRLIARDGMNCCWCGKLTKLGGNSSADNYCTIEHVIRRVDGGRNNMDNCKIACRKCNNTRHHPPKEKRAN